MALPVDAALFRLAAVAVTKVPPSLSPLVPSCDAISKSLLPSAIVTSPLINKVSVPSMVHRLCDLGYAI